MKAIPHVAIYSRVSTREQVDTGISLEAQPVQIHAHLTEKFGSDGYTYEEFSDEGVSGGKGPMPWATEIKTGERQGLWEMLQKLKLGTFTHIAAYRLDRLYRNTLGQLALYDLMKPLGIQYVLVADTFDDSLAGQLTHSILAGVAEYQRKQISDNIARTLDYRRSKGYYLGAIPFGWKNEKEEEKAGERRNIVPDLEEKEVIIRIKDMYLSGMSMKAIAISLNREMVPHKRSVGKWKGQTVNLVLANPTHAGLTRRNENDGYGAGAHFEHRFYEESEFRRILDRMERNRTRLKGVAHTQPFRLFSGIAFCGHCGLRLTANFHNESQAYRCLGNRYSGDGSHVYISAKQLELLIVRELTRLSAEPFPRNLAEAEIEKIIGGRNDLLASEGNRLRKALASLEGRQDNLAKAVANKTVPAPIARRQFEEMSAEEAQLRSQIGEIDRQLSHSQSRADLVRAAKARLEDFGFLWRTMQDSEQRETLHTVIERIDVFVSDGRKWMRVKLATDNEPIEIEILRGAERYRPTGLDGVASLTPRELAALKHVLDGADYVQVSKHFDTRPTNAHTLLKKAKEKLGAATVLEAAKMAEFTVQQMGDQLPLFGKAKCPKHGANRLKAMEYHVLEIAAGGMSMKEIALRTGLHIDRGTELLKRAISKTGGTTAKEAWKKVRNDENLLPITMKNRRRIG